MDTPKYNYVQQYIGNVTHSSYILKTEHLQLAYRNKTNSLMWRSIEIDSFFIKLKDEMLTTEAEEDKSSAGADQRFIWFNILVLRCRIRYLQAGSPQAGHKGNTSLYTLCLLPPKLALSGI